MKDSVILITGITGQVGATLGAHYLKDNNKVVGVVRRSSNGSLGRLEEMGIINNPNLVLTSGDVTDYSSIDRTVKEFWPDLIINCAANSHVGESFRAPIDNLLITGGGCVNMLEVIRNNKAPTYNPYFVQYSSSEMFGGNYSREIQYDSYKVIQHFNVRDSDPYINFHINSPNSFQDEDTPLSSNSPYAAAKIYGHNMTELYREAYGLKTISLICFNMEGEYRGDQFVTRKITKYVASLDKWAKENNIKLDKLTYSDKFVHYANLQFPKLALGNMDSTRDWTHVEDSIRAVDILVDNNKVGPYCVCSNQTHTVKEFIDVAFKYVGITDSCNFVYSDPKFIRPCEVPYLRGRSTRIRVLGWKPTISFYDLIGRMVAKDISRLNP